MATNDELMNTNDLVYTSKDELLNINNDVIVLKNRTFKIVPVDE